VVAETLDDITSLTPVPLEQIEGALEQQTATLREELSMLKSLIEELRRVVGGDREVVHGLVRGSLPTLRGPTAQRSGASGCKSPLRCC